MMAKFMNKLLDWFKKNKTYLNILLICISSFLLNSCGSQAPNCTFDAKGQCGPTPGCIIDKDEKCSPDPSYAGASSGGGLNVKGGLSDVTNAASSYQSLKQSYQATSGNFVPLNIQVNPSKKIYRSTSSITATLSAISAKGAASQGIVNLKATVLWAKKSIASVSVQSTIFSIQCGAAAPGVNDPNTTNLASTNSPTSVDLGTMQPTTKNVQRANYNIDLTSPLTLPDGFKQNDMIVCWIPESN